MYIIRYMYMYMRIDTPFCESERYPPMVPETLKDTRFLKSERYPPMAPQALKNT